MKPKGWGKFNTLARKIVAVPKKIVKAKIATEKAERKKSRKSRDRLLALRKTANSSS